MEFQYDDKSEGIESMYVRHDHKLGKFIDSTGSAIDLSTFAMCPDTVQTGLGRYDEKEGYQYIWDEVTGVPNPDMEAFVKDGYTKAFECYLYTTELGVMCYRRFTLLEWMSWYDAMKQAWNAPDYNKDAQNKVAVFKHAGSERVGKYNNYRPTLEFVKWADRPASFVVEPEVDPFVEPDNSFGGEKVEDKKEDDIPF